TATAVGSDRPNESPADAGGASGTLATSAFVAPAKTATWSANVRGENTYPPDGANRTWLLPRTSTGVKALELSRLPRTTVRVTEMSASPIGICRGTSPSLG